MLYDVRGIAVREFEEAGMEPLLQEILSSEPDIVAWLEPHESKDDEDKQQELSL